VCSASVGLDDHGCVVEEEVHPGHEPTFTVGDDMLLDERQPGADQERAHRRLELRGRRLVARVPLLQQPPQLADAPPLIRRLEGRLGPLIRRLEGRLGRPRPALPAHESPERLHGDEALAEGLVDELVGPVLIHHVDKVQHGAKGVGKPEPPPSS